MVRNYKCIRVQHPEYDLDGALEALSTAKAKKEKVCIAKLARRCEVFFRKPR